MYASEQPHCCSIFEVRARVCMPVLGAFLHMYLTQAALGVYQIRLGRVFTMQSRWQEDELGY